MRESLLPLIVGAIFASVVGPSQYAYAVPPLKLPYLPNETWYVTQGNGGSVSHTGKLQYAWDFNHTSDYLRPVIASAAGTVVFTYSLGGPNQGWGNVVIIDYGDLSFGKVAHLDRVFVERGQKIVQGQVIGLCGNTGTEGPHIHYQTQINETLNGASIPSSFTDVTTNGGVPLGCNCDYDVGTYRYMSGNLFLFDSAFRRLVDHLTDFSRGSPQWYLPWDATNLYNGVKNGIPNNVYIEFLNGGASNSGALIYDALGGGRKAYVLHSGFWTHWSQSGSPASDLGAPIGDEYASPAGSGSIRQDFQRGFLTYVLGRSPEIISSPTPSVMPGMYLDGWKPTTSYAFAEAYERNGGRNTVGDADASPGQTPYVHNWCVNTACVTIQDFWNGSYGDNAIILDYVANDEPHNTNDAFVVRTGFWEWYRANNGPETLGPPKEDEHGNTPEKPCSYQACQAFRKGVLWWTGNGVILSSQTNVVNRVSDVTFLPQLQAASPGSRQFTISFFRPGTSSLIASFTATSNSSGAVSLPQEIALERGTYDIRAYSPHFLPRKLYGQALDSNSTVSLPTLPAGDLNDDGIVNSIDWSIMSLGWFTSNPLPDLNKDGLVNSIDWSIMAVNWFRTAE